MGITRRLRVFAVGALALALGGCASSTPPGTTPSSVSSVAPGTSTSSTGTSSVASTATSAAAASLKIMTGALGSYLTDSAGRTLYMWVADTAGAPTCYAQCATAWPPLTATTAPTAGQGVNAALLKLIARTDGTMQVVYGEYPLYYFVKDTAPGTTLGQGSNGFGAKWWVVGADGEPITTEASVSSSSASGGGGY